MKSLSHVRLFVTPWTVAYQGLQSMGFSRLGNTVYWLPFPSPGDLPNPGIYPGSPALRADALPSELPGKPTVAPLLLSRFSRVDSVRPHRRRPTRLLCPWDSPGKNTGVGCHFLLQSMKVKSEREVAQSCPTLRGIIATLLSYVCGERYVWSEIR